MKNGTKSREFRPSKGRRRLLLLEVGSLPRALSSAEARTRRRLWFVLTLTPVLSPGSSPFGASLPWFLGCFSESIFWVSMQLFWFWLLFGFEFAFIHMLRWLIFENELNGVMLMRTQQNPTTSVKRIKEREMRLLAYFKGYPPNFAEMTRILRILSCSYECNLVCGDGRAYY